MGIVGKVVEKSKFSLRHIFTECRRRNLNLLSIYPDFFWSFLRYGADPLDYFRFEFYRKSSLERKKFITRLKFNRMHKKLNLHPGGRMTRDERAGLIDDKTLFYTYFQNFIGREWLDMSMTDRATFAEFFKKNGAIICKISRASIGRGMFKAVYEPDLVDSIYEKLTSPLPKNDWYIVEQVLDQAPEVAEPAPFSLNTFRIYSILYRNQFYVLAALWRMGRGDLPLDNFSRGGLAAEIDVDTGIVSTLARDKEGVSYLVHPFSHVVIPGRRIPHWKEILDLVETAHRMVPDIGYMGWDAALTANGTPVLVEGNTRGARFILQLVSQTGRWPLVKEICGLR